MDSSDFFSFASKYNTSMEANPTTFISAADFVVNNVIDSADFFYFASRYGTTAKAAKAIGDMPTSDVPFALGAEMDASTSMMYVTVSIDQTTDFDGFAFDMTYDSNVLEFVEDSVSGTVGLAITKNYDDVVHVIDGFIGEDFGGTVTLGFKTMGDIEELTFEITDALINDFEGTKVATNLTEYTHKVAPAVYALSKNYPNPFNPTTTIHYSIPQAGNVELVIYNTAGQKVRSLVNRTQDAAYYKVVWDGRDDSGQSVASGIYFYRLVAGSFSKIEKMTLIK